MKAYFGRRQIVWFSTAQESYPGHDRESGTQSPGRWRIRLIDDMPEPAISFLLQRENRTKREESKSATSF